MLTLRSFTKAASKHIPVLKIPEVYCPSSGSPACAKHLQQYSEQERHHRFSFNRYEVNAASQQHF
ncbi:hypothetical protein [Prevotella sp. OH937_COT-195]|uniref:hypothetical protein n=1 Tax=Prevotella sp. OH937_COT-195 TaxID=2491051 RepID=UPI000F65379C|nr:hypothetical protein [Prevotella sp. OH937_COT-195]RRC99853.1 hypothetical protein EII32_07320 [Prevotella sp. OH937_COT-195]